MRQFVVAKLSYETYGVVNPIPRHRQRDLDDFRQHVTRCGTLEQSSSSTNFNTLTSHRSVWSHTALSERCHSDDILFSAVFFFTGLVVTAKTESTAGGDNTTILQDLLSVLSMTFAFSQCCILLKQSKDSLSFVLTVDLQHHFADSVCLSSRLDCASSLNCTRRSYFELSCCFIATKQKEKLSVDTGRHLAVPFAHALHIHSTSIRCFTEPQENQERGRHDCCRER